MTQSFERVVLPGAAEGAFEERQFRGRVRHDLANMAASLDGLAALVEVQRGATT